MIEFVLREEGLWSSCVSLMLCCFLPRMTGWSPGVDLHSRSASIASCECMSVVTCDQIRGNPLHLLPVVAAKSLLLRDRLFPIRGGSLKVLKYCDWPDRHVECGSPGRFRSLNSLTSSP